MSEESSEQEELKIFPAIWNVLHDGSIVGISNRAGNLHLDVSIGYLRERFPDAGKFIQLTLIGCRRFVYQDFNTGEQFETDLNKIVTFEPEILSAELCEKLNIVDCVGGILEVEADDALIALDSGRSITLQELIAVADAYWTEFANRAKASKLC